MNVAKLAKAVVFWAEYEDLCDRGRFLSEASLKHPISEFLIATQDKELSVEEPYPISGKPQKGRPKAADFCLKRVGGKRPWRAILESKWLSDKRDFSQEIFDDLLRLELVRRPGKSEAFSRYLLVAGKGTDVTRSINEREVNVGGGRTSLFDTVLPSVLGEAFKVSLLNAQKALREYWNDAAKNCNQTKLPLSLRVALVAREDGATYSCLIWRVMSVSKRSTRDVPI